MGYKSKWNRVDDISDDHGDKRATGHDLMHMRTILLRELLGWIWKSPVIYEPHVVDQCPAFLRILL